MENECVFSYLTTPQKKHHPVLKVNVKHLQHSVFKRSEPDTRTGTLPRLLWLTLTAPLGTLQTIDIP